MLTYFSQPFFLLLIPLVWVAVIFVARHGVMQLSRRTLVLATSLRLMAVTLLIVALAGLRLPLTGGPVNTIFLLDTSASILPATQAAARLWIERAAESSAPDDRFALLTFGSETRIEQPFGRADFGDDLPPAGVDEHTNLESALRLAASLFPPNAPKRIVLLSDGNQTAGDVTRAAEVVAAQGAQVDVVPLLAEPGVDAAVTEVAPPSALRAEESFEVRVTVTSTTQGEATLRLFMNETLVSEGPVELQYGQNVYTIQQPGVEEGFYSFRAQVVAEDDQRPQNNDAFGYSQVGPKSIVLVVENTVGDAILLTQALQVAGIQAQNVSPAQLPVRAEDFEDVASVVLVNIPASQLTDQQMQALQDYVQNIGGGLVALGGAASFGMGDYGGTPLEHALPVISQPPDHEELPTLALALLIDKSGSMNEGSPVSKIAMAREAAAQAVEILQTGDVLGVLAFEYSPQWVVRPAPVNNADDAQNVVRRVSTIEAGGGTDIYNALQLAYDTMRRTPAQVKHIILVTDGQSTSAPGLWETLMTRMRRDHITLSAVAIGADADQNLLQRLVRLGDGRYYYADVPENIPQVVTKESERASRSLVMSRLFQPRVVAASPILRAIIADSLPNLTAFVRTEPKPAAETPLLSDTSDVILAQWQYGLGRAVAWTSDAGQDWAADWGEWPQNQRFWAQMVRWTMPSPLNPQLATQVQVDGNDVTVSVDSVDEQGSIRNLLNTEVAVAGPELRAFSQNLPQTAPGRYEGTLTTDKAGVYALKITQYDGDTPVVEQITGAVVPVAAEFLSFETDYRLLRRLAVVTGGKVLANASEAFRHDRPPPEGYNRPFWQPLVVFALILFVADIGVRRLRFTWYELGVFGAVVRSVRLPRLQIPAQQAMRRRLERLARVPGVSRLPGLGRLRLERRRPSSRSRS
jgi:uncharacterized membrane protein